MNNNKAFLYGALIGDGLALGPHWIYTPSVIFSRFGHIDGFTSPAYNTYHNGKAKGDQTHYGDQIIHLVENLSLTKEFDIETYSSKWLEFMNDYEGYKDKAMKESSELLLNDDTGSTSSDFAGSLLALPLFLLSVIGEDKLINFVRLTHNNQNVIDTMVFYHNLYKLSISGSSPTKSIETLYETSTDFIKNSINKAKEHLDKPTEVAIKEIGQSCDVSVCLPSSIYLLLKYKDDLKSALLMNVLAGGDSAARGIFVGSIIAGYTGMYGIDKKWIKELNSSYIIEEFFS